LTTVLCCHLKCARKISAVNFASLWFFDSHWHAEVTDMSDGFWD
jgi:hypothetical protein